MKLNHRFLLLFVVLFTSSILFSQGYKDTLTNKSIIELRKNNLGVDIIKMKITKSFCAFDLSVDGLIQLKKNGISDEIITSMLTYQTGGENSANIVNSNQGNRFASNQSSSNSSNDSKTSEKNNLKSTRPGIYYCIGSAPELIQLETSVFSSTKSGFDLTGTLSQWKVLMSQAEIRQLVLNNCFYWTGTIIFVLLVTGVVSYFDSSFFQA